MYSLKDTPLSPIVPTRVKLNHVALITMDSLAILTVDNMGVDIFLGSLHVYMVKKLTLHYFYHMLHFHTLLCYHQSHHFHHMLSPIKSSFLCLPYRRKLDVRSSQLLPAVLPVPLIGINTSTAWLSVETTRLLTVELLLHLQEIYIFTINICPCTLSVCSSDFCLLPLSLRTYSTKLVL